MRSYKKTINFLLSEGLLKQLNEHFLDLILRSAAIVLN